MTELADKLATLIRDELAESQVNKNKKSEEYRLGKNEAYMKILSIISEDIVNRTTPENIEKIDEQWDKINSIIKK